MKKPIPNHAIYIMGLRSDLQKVHLQLTQSRADAKCYKTRVYDLTRALETATNALSCALELIDKYAGDAPNGLVKPLRLTAGNARATLEGE